MKRILGFLKKLKPNQKIFIDLVLVMIVFGLLNNFYKNKYPTKVTKKTNDFFINLTVDRRIYKENSIVNVNLDIQNRKKIKLIKSASEINYEIKVLNGNEEILSKKLFDFNVDEKKIYFEKSEKKKYSVYLALGKNEKYNLNQGMYKLIVILGNEKKIELPLNVVQGE